MAFHYSPKIVTDGLVLYLDAANTKSYISGSTTWNDISRGGSIGTLVNGPTFNSANGGSIVFDGVNDYITTNFQCPSVSTIEITIKSLPGNTITATFLDGWSSNNVTGILITKNGDTTVRVLIGNGVSFNTTNIPTSLLNDSYYTINVVNTGSNSLIYLNGLFQITNTNIYAPANNISLGARISNAVNYWKGLITNVKIYNKVLSAEEILQNYNATKSRFGL
jgi:hypothetical protein